MTLKSKLIATISAFCLVVGMLIAGVWASLHVQVEMGGDLIFTATDVNVRVSGKIEGMETTEETGVMTLPTITFSANPDENSPSTVLDQWKNNALTFTQAGDDITITITIENLNDRVVNVKVKDSVGASAGVNKIIKNGSTIESATEVLSGKEVKLNGNSTTYYTITLSLKDRNDSLLEGVRYGYIIDLSDSSYFVPVQSTNESLGQVSYTGKFEIGQSVTLSANFVGPDAEFLGWAKDGEDGEIVADTMEYTFNYDETSGKTYYAVFQNIGATGLAYDFLSDGTNSASAKSKEEGGASGYIIVPSKVIKDNNIYTIESLSAGAFVMCSNLKTVVLPSCIKSLGEVAFGLSGVEKVVLPEGLKEIAIQSFYSCEKLSNINIPSTVATIGLQAFVGCKNLSSIFIPKNVENIGDCAFLSAGLNEVIFEESSKLNQIGSQAFSICENLNSITLPSSVNYISDQVFGGSNLIELTILAATPPELVHSNSIPDSVTKIYIPAGTSSAYTTATNWSSFADKFEELPA